MRSFRLVCQGLFLVCLFVRSALVSAEAGHDVPTLEWMPDHVDWASAQEVFVALDDNSFSPDDVVFKQNRPYKLVLKNISDRVTHDLVDLGFFHSVVAKEVSAGGVTVNTPHIHSLVLRPLTEAVLYFVPIKPSEFEIYCSVEGHREDGMEGYFTIEP